MPDGARRPWGRMARWRLRRRGSDRTRRVRRSLGTARRGTGDDAGPARLQAPRRPRALPRIRPSRAAAARAGGRPDRPTRTREGEDDMRVLEGKAAIVTGSARGIGRATAELLCAHGARVLVNDLDTDLAEEAASAMDGDTAVFAGDLTEEGVCEALVERAVAEFGQLDIVVNNAGYTWDGIAQRMSDEQFRAMLEIHTVVPFRVLRAAAPYLREPAKQIGRASCRERVMIERWG